jgi:hypothetical protein
MILPTIKNEAALLFYTLQFRYKRERFYEPCELQFQVIATYSLLHLLVCLTTGPKHLPKRALHIGRVEI